MSDITQNRPGAISRPDTRQEATRGERPGAAATGVEETGVPTFAEYDTRVVSIGAILFILADLFYFASWWFAFFYLRARNENNAWLIKGVTHPNRLFGGVVIALIVLSAIAFFVASRAERGGSGSLTLVGSIAFILGTIAVILGVYQLWHLGFGMTDGGYPSVFVGLWGSIVVHVAGAMLWLLSILLQRGPESDTELRPWSPQAFGRILTFIAAVSVISYLILYFVV